MRINMSFALALNALTFIITIYNCVVVLYQKKVSQFLVLLFYIFVFASIISSSIDITTLIVAPHVPNLYDH